MKRLNTDALRLLFKGLVTAWVPVFLIMGWVSWDAQQAAVIMGASTFTVDGVFAVFKPSSPAPPASPG